MSIKVNKITIRNFKNLKNVTIYPKKFNVLIGPNGSGKTNFLEFFKLLRKIYVERNPYPFLEWNGYENVVWNHRTYLPVEFEFEIVERTSLSEFIRTYSFDELKLSKDVSFDIFRRISASFWTDGTETLKILKESIESEIPAFNFRSSIEKVGEKWIMEVNNERYEKDEMSSIKSLHIETLNLLERRIGILESFERSDNKFMFMVYSPIMDILFEPIKENFKFELLKLNKYFDSIDVLPKEEIKKYKKSISEIFFETLFLTMSMPLLILFKSLVLFSPNLYELKYKRRIIPRDEALSERGENALDILALIQLRENKLPERIEYVTENYFNGRVYFKNMNNFYLYDTNKKVEFSKEHLPDGFIKLLVILTALEQKPSILLIDEIENSLHPELIEFIVETLRECNCTFVTTHSPIVLDLVEPEEVWIFRPSEEGAEIRNLTEYKSKEELLKELEELGISLGEKVLYGYI